MIDVKTPSSPGWWLDRLLKKLAKDYDRFQRLSDYYECENVLPPSSSRSVKEGVKRLLELSRTNYAALSVQAPLERMKPTGFRTGAAGDRLGDKEAWRIWQANGLDTTAPMTFEASLSMSMGFMIVGPVNPDIGAPLITPEDPREVTVETDPTNRRRVLAGLKVFRDDVAGTDRAYLYLPGKVYRAKRRAGVADFRIPADTGGWEWDGEDELPFQQVPVVPFPCNPRMNGVGVGEFERHTAVLDRINYLTLQGLEIATLQAFRQRAVKGDFPDHDEQGNPIDYDDIFSSEPGALWKLPATAELWESGAVDLRPLSAMTGDQVKSFAAVSGTPLFYITPEAPESAEGASLARERLLSKTSRHIVDASDPLEQVMSLAFRYAGDETRANREAMEVIWAPPGLHSLAEKADAAAKALASGMTWRKVMEDIWQLTPPEIEEMEAERRAEALMAQGAALLDQVVNGGASAERQSAAV